MEAIAIRKHSGALVPFDAERIRQGVMRAGATRAQADEVVFEVARTLRSGMTTREVYAFVDAALYRRNASAAARYGLRDALLRLGPAGFHFERYLAALWAAQGYETELPDELEGGCVKHEVDVLCRKDGKLFAVEAKFRNIRGDGVHLKDVMASYARYLDLLDGAALHRCPHIAEFWIVTNGGFSDRAKRFGQCKGLRLLGWRYPHDRGLAQIIDRFAFYPVTILRELSPREVTAFAQADLMLCNDLVRLEHHDVARRTGLPVSRVAELAELAAQVHGQPSATPRVMMR